VWLSEPARALILDGGDGRVFEVSTNELQTAMRAICAELGAERATRHDLRRTAATVMEEIGVSPDTIDRVLNHKLKGVRAAYQRHRQANQMQAALAALAARLLQLAAGGPAAGNVVQLTSR
jgi:integrase